MTRDPRYAWLALSRISGIGRVLYRRLIDLQPVQGRDLPAFTASDPLRNSWDVPGGLTRLSPTTPNFKGDPGGRPGRSRPRRRAESINQTPVEDPANTGDPA